VYNQKTESIDGRLMLKFILGKYMEVKSENASGFWWLRIGSRPLF
jgi:hypothetical protein